MSPEFARSNVLPPPVQTGPTTPPRNGIPAELAEVDPSGLWRRLVDFPQQAAHAWQMGSRWTGVDDAGDIRRVLLVGMGGSAIGGQLAGQIVEQRAPVTVEVIRDS